MISVKRQFQRETAEHFSFAIICYFVCFVFIYLLLLCPDAVVTHRQGASFYIIIHFHLNVNAIVIRFEASGSSNSEDWIPVGKFEEHGQVLQILKHFRD